MSDVPEPTSLSPSRPSGLCSPCWTTVSRWPTSSRRRSPVPRTRATRSSAWSGDEHGTRSTSAPGGRSARTAATAASAPGMSPDGDEMSTRLRSCSGARAAIRSACSEIHLRIGGRGYLGFRAVRPGGSLAERRRDGVRDEGGCATCARGRARGAAAGAGGIATVLEPEGEAHAGRFEGLYGGLYDRAIQTDVLRRFASVAYGDAGPVTDLDGFVKRVATGTHAVRGRSPGAARHPLGGGGTLLPGGCGAAATAAGWSPPTSAPRCSPARPEVADRVPLDVALLRADAQDLPLQDASVDAACQPQRAARHARPARRSCSSSGASCARAGGCGWSRWSAAPRARTDLVIRVGS